MFPHNIIKSIVLLSLFFVSAFSAYAKDVPVVEKHQLDCGDVFACPDVIKRRVDFWIHVFREWKLDEAVFHHKNHPEIVYSVIKSKEGCRKLEKRRHLKKERKRIQDTLKGIAGSLQAGKELSSYQRKIADQFTYLKPANFRDAAKNVRCQSGNRERFAEALENFHHYQPDILQALNEQGLSNDIQYLPFVESAFNPKALSHVGAAGLWQIMPITGRKLGLRVTNAVDERYDPTKASFAAAKYFRNSTDSLTELANEKSITVSEKAINPFIITSYNYGVTGMKKGIRKVGLDYTRLLTEYKSPRFQTAVKNFYSSFVAARYVAKNSERYFGKLGKNDLAEKVTDVTMKRSTSAKRLASVFSVSKERLKELNPALTRQVWRGKALVPAGYVVHLPFAQHAWQAEVAKLDSLPQERVIPDYIWHKVRRGETACGIARKHRVSCRRLISMNGLNRRATIYAGKRIKIPSGKGGIALISDASSHVVRRGETACGIARKYSVSCQDLLSLNNLNNKSILQIGQQLALVKPAAVEKASQKKTAPSSAQKSPVDQTASVASKNWTMWHKVQKGQTACEIAEQYSVSCKALLSANSLTANSKLRIGQKLTIPGSG